MDPYRSGVYVALDSYFAHAFHLQWKKLRLDAEMLRQIIRYGFPSGVQNSVIGLANVVVHQHQFLRKNRNGRLRHLQQA